MTNKTILFFGALLHDVGKVVYRGSSGKGTHSKLGADFISQEIAAINADFETEKGRKVVEQIRYHHAKEIKGAPSIQDDSLAFITYFADNISAGMDRKNEGDEEQTRFFDKNVKLRKIFNILNDRNDDNIIDHEDYNLIRERIRKGLMGIKISSQEVNSLLNLLEATTSAVPSSTNRAQLVDISLYDHAKTTAGIAACVYDYLAERGISDYRKALFDPRSSDGYYAAPMFLLYSCDMSGIQDFIYNISGSGALKQLRARSLYLEILLEHIVDELLERLELSRANLLYTGGGHGYLILPNTGYVKEVLQRFDEELQAWFVDRYRTDLYLASTWIECCADDLMNKGDDKQRYPDLYRRLSQQLSAVKASRYTALTIRELNFGAAKDYDHGRECTECHRSDLSIDEDGKCSLCAAFGQTSSELVVKEVLVVRASTLDALPSARKSGLVLPFDRELIMYSYEEYLAKKPDAVRIYTKNRWDMGIELATHIWMGDYTADVNGERFKAYSEQGATLESERGIERLGVLRADVDNLGVAFVSGLPADKVSISRTATFSRALSYFFKFKINEIMSGKGYQAQIIYSGGDDLFVVGNWSDIIHAAIDIRRALDEFTGNGVLTISAGVGMFDANYPIARMAAETGELEDAAKMYSSGDGSKTAKNAIALWSVQTVFRWDEFIDIVMPRVDEVRWVFEDNEKGKAFVYRLIALLRSFNDVISVPRLAYLLARSFEDDEEHGAETCRRFYDWAMDDKERSCLIAALEWYVYSVRERG